MLRKLITLLRLSALAAQKQPAGLSMNSVRYSKEGARATDRASPCYRYLTQVLAAAAILLCVNSPASAQIAVDSTASASVNSVSNNFTLTWSHTVGSGTNRLLVVGLASVESDDTSACSVTYGGQYMTRQVLNTGNPVSDIWTLVAPPTGTASIVATFQQAAEVVGGSVSFTGVDQTTPVRASNQARASLPGSVIVSTSVTSAVGDVVIDAVANAGGMPEGAPAAGQTVRWTLHNPGKFFTFGGGSTKPGAAGSTTMSWTLSSNPPFVPARGAIAAISLIPAPPPSPPTISKAFNPTSIPLGGTSTLTFTIANPNSSTTLTNVNFSDSFPAGVQVASSPNPSTTCIAGTTVTGAASMSTMVSVNIPSLAGGGSCTVSLDVTSTSAGMKNNTTGPISSDQSGAGATSNTATFPVTSPQARAWKTVGSTGTIDEDSQAIAAVSNFAIGLAPGATGTVTVRYNIMATQGISTFCPATQSTVNVRFRNSDNTGTHAQVKFEIHRTRIATGGNDVIFSFNSNGLGAGSSFTSASVMPAIDLDFNNYVYWIEATIFRDNASQFADLGVIEIYESAGTVCP